MCGRQRGSSETLRLINVTSARGLRSLDILLALGHSSIGFLLRLLLELVYGGGCASCARRDLALRRVRIKALDKTRY